MATIHIEFSRVRIFRRMKRAEARIAYLESRVRELSEELDKALAGGGAIQPPPRAGTATAETAGGAASVQQIMDEYLNFPDERREAEQEGKV